MAIFGVYRVVDVECKARKGFPSIKLHIENPSTGKTFCGKYSFSNAQKMFFPHIDCQTCYVIAEKKARPLLLKIKAEK